MQLAFDFGVDKREPAADVDASRGRRGVSRGHGNETSARAGPVRAICFFAIVPDRQAALQVDELAVGLRRQYQLKGRLIGVDRYHVSLHQGVPIGCSPAELVTRMKRAADSVSARGFALGFDQAMSFSRTARTHAFVLSSSDELTGLNELHRALGHAMAPTGLRIERSFTPHLTMLYDVRLVPKMGVPLIRWTAHDFVLIRSWQGDSHHEQLAQWPLSPIATL